jgi:hypothetical protein
MNRQFTQKKLNIKPVQTNSHITKVVNSITYALDFIEAKSISNVHISVNSTPNAFMDAVENQLRY